MNIIKHFKRIEALDTLGSYILFPISIVLPVLSLSYIFMFQLVPDLLPTSTFLLALLLTLGIPGVIGLASKMTSLYLLGRSQLLAGDLQDYLNEKYELALSIEDAMFLINNLDITENEAMSHILDLWLEHDDHHYHAPALLYISGEEIKLLSIIHRSELVTPGLLSSIETVTDFHNELASDNARPVYVKQVKEGTIIFSEKLRAQLFFGSDVELEEVPQDRFWSQFFNGDVKMIMNPTSHDDLQSTFSPKEVKHILAEY